MTRFLFAIVFATGLSGPLLAEFSGEGELGLVVARGNSETETVNGRLTFAYTRERWTNESNFSLVRSSDSGETRASRFVLANKTDYELTDRSYLLAALRYDKDQFASDRYQATAALGFGYYLVDTERHKLKSEIGPGVRRNEVRETGQTETHFIMRGFLDYRWAISETARLTNRLLVESASDNTFAENELALTVAVNSRLSLKAGVAVRHNSDVEPDLKSTDTLTTVNLVYKFPSG